MSHPQNPRLAHDQGANGPPHNNHFVTVRSEHKSELELVHHTVKFIGPVARKGDAGFVREINHEFVNLQGKKRQSQKTFTDSYKWVAQKLAKCLKDMHDEDHQHGGLEPSCVYVASGKEKGSGDITIAAPGNDNKTRGETNDIEQLGKLYYFLLTNGCTAVHAEEVKAKNLKCKKKAEKEVAADLICKMMSRKIKSIGEVLDHPFHWQDSEKIQYLVDVFDFMKLHELAGETQADHERRVEDYKIDAEGVIPEEDWIGKLMLKTEKDNIKLDDNEIISVPSDIIHKLARQSKEATDNSTCDGRTEPMEGGLNAKKRNERKSGKKQKKEEKSKKKCKTAAKERNSPVEKVNDEPGPSRMDSSDSHQPGAVEPTSPGPKQGPKYVHGPYDHYPNSVYHLIRFFRNYQAHYWENDRDIQVAFGEKDSGYWRFFGSRFPKLICHVYDRMKEHVKPKHVMSSKQ